MYRWADGRTNQLSLSLGINIYTCTIHIYATFPSCFYELTALQCIRVTYLELSLIIVIVTKASFLAVLILSAFIIVASIFAFVIVVLFVVFMPYS